MLHGRHALWLQGQEEFCLHWPVLLTRVVFQSVALTSLTVDYSGYGCVGPCSNESNFLQVTESFSACLVDIYLASCRKGNSGLNLPRSHEHVLLCSFHAEIFRIKSKCSNAFAIVCNALGRFCFASSRSWSSTQTVARPCRTSETRKGWKR